MWTTYRKSCKSITRWADRKPCSNPLLLAESKKFELYKTCKPCQEERSHCTRVRQLPRQVLRTLSRPLQLTPSPFGQLSVSATHPPAASFCPPPAGGRQLYPIIFASAALRHNTAVDPAGSGPAAYRPSSVPHCRPHGGGGGRCTLVRSFLPPECSLPQIQKHFITIKRYSYVLHQEVCKLLGNP
jgi:hypothetical protein